MKQIGSVSAGAVAYAMCGSPLCHIPYFQEEIRRCEYEDYTAIDS